jgi:hypothetical protein
MATGSTSMSGGLCSPRATTGVEDCGSRYDGLDCWNDLWSVSGVCKLVLASVHRDKDAAAQGE